MICTQTTLSDEEIGIFEASLVSLSRSLILTHCTNIEGCRDNVGLTMEDRITKIAYYQAILFSKIKELDANLMDKHLVSRICTSLTLTPLELIAQIDSQPHKVSILKSHLNEQEMSPIDFLQDSLENDINNDLIKCATALLAN